MYTYMDSLLPLKGRKDQTLISVFEVTQSFNFTEGVEPKAKNGNLIHSINTRKNQYRI